jgi:hypothetical protein
MSPQKYASFAVEDLKEGSNLIDNFDGVLSSFKFTKEAPDNYTAEGSPIFMVFGFALDAAKFTKQQGEDEDAYQARLHPSQSYSLGAKAGDDFIISEDGYGLIPQSDDAAIRKDCKAGTVIASLQNEGLPKPILQAGDFSKVIGLNAHWKRVPDKERNFGDIPGRKQRVSKFPPSTLVCTKILGLPGTTSNPTSLVTSTPNVSTVQSSGTSDVDIKSLTLDYLNKVLDAKKGEVQRGNLTLFLSQAAAKDANRQAIAKMGADEAFLMEMASLDMIAYDPAAKPQVVRKVAVTA